MNFAQMLAQEVKPLPDTRDPGRVKRDWRDPTAMHEARHSQAAKKYCAEIGTEWTRTGKIAERLGMGRMSIFKQLVKYHEIGILERRPVGGTYNHYHGWEWRVK